jgi:glycerol-3-phosphate acyltransferase PlsY
MVWIITAYLLGSIPFGYLLAKYCGAGDIRQHGSGNIGATNVLRVAGKKLGLITLILDGAKGGVVVYLTHLFAPEMTSFVAFFAVIGHIFPVWLKFRGGKGVITAIVALLVCRWEIAAAIIILWLLTFIASKISSLAAITAFLGSPLITYLFIDRHQYFYLNLILSIIIISRHASNIRRLSNGTEGKTKL